MTELIPQITGVIGDTILTICGLVFTGVFIPWLVKTAIPWLKEKHLYTIVSTFVKAAEFFGVSLDYLAGRTDRRDVWK